MNPDKHTIQETFIEVGDGHTLYVHDWGNAKAKLPIIFLHGGPGSQVKDRHKTSFDPTKQRVVFFDQRGCGKSLPYGSLDHNTTKDLVADIHTLASHLKIKQFILTGGSWGSCLALAYALAHPGQVKAVVLHGVFTGSQAEIDWLDKGRFQTFFPEVWLRYLDSTPKVHQSNPSAYHFKRILGKDESAQRESGYIYSNLEGSVLFLDDRFTPEDPADFDPAGIRLEVHYLANRCFMPDRHILNNVHKLTMPIWLVQGRYDMVCPPTTAYELSQKLPNSHLIWTVNGHGPGHEAWNVMRTIFVQLR